MIGSYLGETTGRLKRIFEYVRTTPCVLFFDEFDAVGKERGDIHETGEIKRIVTSLLMNVDELPSYSVVIAATNHSELLDRTVWRRFQLRLTLPAPTEKELTRYFERFSRHWMANPDLRLQWLRGALENSIIAEAEEFTLDIRRREILSMKERPLKEIVESQLKLWEARAQPQTSREGQEARLNA